MGLHGVQELVSGKRSECNAGGEREERDEGRGHLRSGDLSEDDSGGEHDEVSVAALNMDKCGRLRLETVDDLFNILQLRKRRRERKAPVYKKTRAAPAEMLPDTVEAPLFFAAAVDDKMAVVHKYLNEGGNPDAVDHFQRTALHKASFKGHVEVMTALLDAGAAIDWKDKLESTAVHWACRGGNLPALQLLLQRGAKITARDKLHSCPLHVAVRTGHLECAEYLIHCGADVNAKDRDGDTCMHDAVRINRFKMIKLLMMYGASLNVKNCDGKTPMETLYSWQNGAKSLLFHFSEEKAELNEKMI
ncbi:ankyrin repeat domain-containing protein 1-like isoform X1 [Phycodurus eques]|uniref:ankyrin repeat domain-containing protein 1-like isoform X1 n=2 Tax=Phycodurus eques TaxID=693459 RepID=UPI002ACDE55C|nr:ankyrin repeat domain-containing protein 1-like isoform X1 [Phycodurus eques]